MICDWLDDEFVSPLGAPWGFVEFGRTSTRKDSRPAIHRVVHDLARGPYHHELVPVDRSPFDRLHRDLQNPEGLKARQASIQAI
jgi:hypothetical protein